MKQPAIRFGTTTLLHAAGLVALTVAGFLIMAGFAGAMVDVPVLLERMARVDGSALGWLAVAIFFHVGLRLFRWPLMLRALRLNVSATRMALYYMAGTALVPTPGKIGTALRLWLLKRHHAIDYTASAPMLVLENVTDFLALTVLAAVAFVPVAHHLGGMAGVGMGLLMMAGLLGVVLALLLKPSLLVYGLTELQHAVARYRGVVKALEQAKMMLADLRRLATPRVMVTTFALSVGGWVAAAVGFLEVIRTLGFEVDLMQAVFVLSVGTLMGAVTLLPGGLGGTEATMAGLLLAFGMPLADVVVAVAVIRIALLWVPVLAGFLVLPLAIRKRG